MSRSKPFWRQRLFLAVLVLLPWTAAAQPATVVVDSTSSAIDGNTAGIASLAISPGYDGVISLMEAIAAANNTPGPKRIVFSPALRGKTIPFGSNDIADLLRFGLESSDLTLDGDVDGDGVADVTLDASGRTFATLRVRASNITIQHLVFREFGGQAINFACGDVACVPRTIANVHITGNVFDSQRGGAVEIGVLGILGSANNPLLSDFTFSDIVIDGNTVRGPLQTFADGIGARACSDGVFRNRFSRVRIANNHLSIHTAIDASAADEALPPSYSDRCVLEDLVIDGNVIEDAQTGIYLDSANLGNQNNVAQRITITNNRLLRPRTGMRIGAANLPDPTRATSFNVMSDLLVSGNEIADAERAVIIAAGNWPLADVAPTAVDDNTLSGVRFIGNDIHGYRFTGLQVYGAVGASSSGAHTSSRNRLDGLTITGNRFETSAGGFPAGVEIVGGQSNGTAAASNEILRVTIAGNVFRGNSPALSVIGGRRPGATGNRVSIEAMSPNTFEGNAQDLFVAVDTEGAVGNRIEITSKRRGAAH